MKSRSWFDLIAINIFWLGINIRNNAVHAIYLPYLVEMSTDPAFQNSALGVARSAGLIIAMLAQPTFGLLSDRNTSRFGRRRPYIFTGVLLDVLFILLLARSNTYIHVLISILLIQVSSNMSHGPMQALIPDLVPENQRGVASSIKSIFELLPIAFMGVTFAALVGAGKFNLSVLVTLAALVVIMLLTMVLVKETPNKTPSFEPLTPLLLRIFGLLGGIIIGSLFGLMAGAMIGSIVALIATILAGREVFLSVMVGVGGITMIVVSILASTWVGITLTIGKREALEQKSFTWWVVNRLMFLTAIGSIQSFAPYFMMNTFDYDIETAISIYGRLISIVGIFILISALPSGSLSDRIGQKKLIGVSGIIAATSTLALLLTIWLPNLTLIYMAGVGLGIAAGFFAGTNWALGTRLVPQSQAGRFLGISNLAGAGAGIIGAGFGGFIADTLNQLAAGTGYLAIFSGFGILFIISIICLAGITQPKKG